MATTPISALATIGTINPAADVLPIVSASLSTTFKVTPNALFGITGSVVGTTDSQTLTNKTLTSPTVSSPTLSGTVGGTYTLGGTPTFPSSVVTLTDNQTLTNKTLTGPAITGGNISNASIAVDNISGFTSSAIVTVGGVQMDNGQIGTSGSVTTAAIATGAVVPNSLQASTGTGWSWQSYAPTVTLTGGGASGNAVITGRYIQIGKTVFFWCSYVLGNTTSFSGLTGMVFSLPVTMSANFFAGSINGSIGTGQATDNNNSWVLAVAPQSVGAVSPYAGIASSAYTERVDVSASVPFSWANADLLQINGMYEAA